MYRYDEFDRSFVTARVEQFRRQVARRLSGKLSEDEFKPLRLMNGLYHQLHAYMLRVAVPYGTLSARQMRMLAHIADKYDRGYGHFTTRQNIQYNWIRLEDAADILADLASVEMHAIQTSGNCIRNTTTDQYAGAAADELADPRPVCELIRQWSTLHPEFSFLPRKFKIAVTGSPNDRAAVKVHDIGLRLHLNQTGERGWEVIVGGGQGRTPMVGVTVREWLPEAGLLPYLSAIMRVYNSDGRRDNKYKARIKILVHETGNEAFREAVEAEFAAAPKETV
ncbi:MAG: nitrite/sulfite reductase, partial [Anderseniella sp.]|nr:nitrite/sulfite reductase [Anderseniella sp.]